MGPEDSEVDPMYILTHARRRAAGFSRSSVRKRKVSIQWQARYDGMSVRGRGWRWKEKQEGTCKMLTTRTTIAGQRLVKGLQRE